MVWTDVRAGKKAAYFPSLDSSATIAHSGVGGSYWWVDSTYEIVGVVLSVTPDFGPLPGSHLAVDHIVDIVTSAVV